MSALAYPIPPRFTYGEYVQWVNDDRWELIDGEAYLMSPAPTTRHQRVKARLFNVIFNFLEGKSCEAFDAPFDVRLPDHDEADEEVRTVVQPDIVVICDKAKIDKKGCRGAPDFVVEIISPSTSARDRVEKAALYQRHGVREYWVVHPDENWIAVHILGPTGQYSPPRVVLNEGRLSIATLPGLDIHLDAVFAP